MSGRQTRSMKGSGQKQQKSSNSATYGESSSALPRYVSEDLFADELPQQGNSATASPTTVSVVALHSVATNAASKSKKTSKKRQASKRKPKATKKRQAKGCKAPTTAETSAETAPNGSREHDHLLPDSIYRECIEPVAIPVPDSDCTPVPSSGDVGAGSQSGSAFSCVKCGKGFATNHGFIKHVMTHGIEDANLRRPDANVLMPEIDVLLISALEEIQLEYGNEKKQFVKNVLNAIETRPEDWHQFVLKFAVPFLDVLSKPTKIMPSNQYEEQLMALNKMLNEKESYNSLLHSLKFLTFYESGPSNSQTDSPVPGMVLFRLTSKFLDKLTELVFVKMLKNQPEQETFNYQIRDEVEKRAFALHIRKLIQDLYVRGLSLGSKVWLARCACIRKRFIETYDDYSDREIIEMICQDDSWTEDDSGQVKLKLFNEVISFFLELEEIIESVICNKSLEINSDSVVNIVLMPEKSKMLDLWHSLTVAYFSEVEALVFLKDVTTMVTSLSLRLEEGRIRGRIVDGRAPKYALRSDLQRNL